MKNSLLYKGEDPEQIPKFFITKSKEIFLNNINDVFLLADYVLQLKALMRLNIYKEKHAEFEKEIARINSFIRRNLHQ